MQILKKRLKNSLSNKIVSNQLTPYNIFYIIIDSSETLTSTIKKKSLTKLLFAKNFKSLRNSAFIYPICYVSSEMSDMLLKNYKLLSQHPDFKKILIYNIQIKFLNFKNINTLNFYHLNNNLLTFYKLYFLLNSLLLNFAVVKQLTKK